MTIRIAQLSCGTEYSGVQHQIDEAAASVGAKIVYPDVSYADVKDALERFGMKPKSPQLQLMIARAMSLADGRYDADAVFITTCFRCAEAALVRNELRRFVQENTSLPVVTYSFTERLKASQLLTRMEALVTIVARKELLARERQTGLTAGLDSGSSTTKAVVMRDNEIIGKAWTGSGGVIQSATQVLEEAMRQAGVELKEIEAIGTTGYGRFTLGRHFGAKLVQEELTVNSKGAVWLADRQRGEATIIDIGGMDNKAITIRDGIPDNFTMGGICAGASGRFLENTARRLKVDIADLGDYAVKGDWRRAPMNSYCTVFGIQDLVTQLGDGKTFEDVAAAACHSVAEQVFEQQLQEIDVRRPIIEVGGTSLNKGLVKALGEVLGEPPIVPPDSQYIGAVGGALLSSGFLRGGRHGGHCRRGDGPGRVRALPRPLRGDNVGRGEAGRRGEVAPRPQAGGPAVHILGEAEGGPGPEDRGRRGVHPLREGQGLRERDRRGVRPGRPEGALGQVRARQCGADRPPRRRRGRGGLLRGGRRADRRVRRAAGAGGRRRPVEGHARGHPQPQGDLRRRRPHRRGDGGDAEAGVHRGGGEDPRRDGPRRRFRRTRS